jgi:hypothetical protein
MSDRNPYTEQKSCPRSFTRMFSKADAEEFDWHRDREDRVVSSDSDWKVQLDDSLPVSLNKPVWIPMGVYHRIIPGKDLKANVKVIKL